MNLKPSVLKVTLSVLFPLLPYLLYESMMMCDDWGSGSCAKASFIRKIVVLIVAALIYLIWSSLQNKLKASKPNS